MTASHQQGDVDAEGSTEPRLRRCSEFKWLKIEVLGHFFQPALSSGDEIMSES